ncbi:MAG: amidohydrolase family protein [Gulosibacter sp.]|uniref:amidohydrolase family protein n=1 Tax=Gulosibacter sp. TaxID=2817531 RepID=UPI003F91E95B
MTTRYLIRNAGVIVSGDPSAPLVDGNAIAVADGKILAVGDASSLPHLANATVIDAQGCTVVPGLIDSHAHPVIGDFTPRQQALGWSSRALNGGVTGLISAGETHWPGRSKDGPEAKAICAAAYLTSRNRQVGCARIWGGALLLDSGLTTSDIDELHELGVKMLGEIGLGSEKDTAKISELVAYAISLGWVAPLHFGGASVPGSSVVGIDMAREVRPTIISHINGGPTSRGDDEIFELLEESEVAVEVVFAGNMKMMRKVVEKLIDRGELSRLQFGTDTPSGTGVVPLGMLRLLTEATSGTELDPATALSLASGGTARRYGLAGRGVITEGAHADLIILDAAKGGSSSTLFDAMRDGNVPAVSLVMVDGVVEVAKSSVTPPPSRPVTIG